jgi:hypothetical protein
MPHLSQQRTAADAERSAAPQRLHPSTTVSLLALQRAAGNRAVRRLLRRVGEPGLVSRAGAGRRLVQRNVNVPEDVASEMVGRTFRLAKDFVVGSVTHPAGELVQAQGWDNVSETVPVMTLPFPSPHPPFDVPKELIRPAEDVVPGVAPYDVDLEKVVKKYEANERRLKAERARTTDPRPDEVSRLEGLQANRLKLLNERLIQGTMFNRFDADIKRWTEHYNAKFGFTGTKAADPDMVKAMIFEESQMGTAGPHLDDPPTHPVRTRFNIGQMIDTSSLVLLELIREDEPLLIETYHLQDIEQDLIAAQNELERLNKVARPNVAQQARIDELTRLSGRDWEVFMWEYKAAGQTAGFGAAVLDYFGDRGGRHRNLSYEFWIRASVRELFDKRKLVSSWEEAARAYNGAGPRARRYKAAVTARMAAAKAALKAKKPFVVDNI